MLAKTGDELDVRLPGEALPVGMGRQLVLAGQEVKAGAKVVKEKMPRE